MKKTDIINNGVYYTISVQSGKRHLEFMIDSGASRGNIINSQLLGCLFDNVVSSSNVIDATGKIEKARRIFLHLDFVCTEETYNCKVLFSVLPYECSELFKKLKVDGVIGANFLQYSYIDFIHSILYFCPNADNIYK